MGGGVAKAIKTAGGDEIEREAVSKAPISLGKAVSSTAGRLHAKYIIHAPTMREPAQKIPLQNVSLAVNAALNCASELGVSSLAFPGMGTGVGCLSVDDAAREMVHSILSFSQKYPDASVKDILLVGFSHELTSAFEKWLNSIPETR